MDQRLRDLQRQAQASGDVSSRNAFLAAAYRAGYYREPTRQEIIDILRWQISAYWDDDEDSEFEHRADPRYYYEDDAINASNLQHPSELDKWGGDIYEGMESAYQAALPGEVFEVSTYSRPWSGDDWDWNLIDTITVSVPAEVYEFGGRLYGPPSEDFKVYPRPSRRNPDEDIRRLERQALNDPQAAERLRVALIRAGALECEQCGQLGAARCTILDEEGGENTSPERCEEIVCPNCVCDNAQCEFVRNVKSVEERTGEVGYFSTGACPGCPQCGLEDLEDFDDDPEHYRIDAVEEGFFSWSPCETCHSHLGGDRYPAHDSEQGELIHWDICQNCFQYFNFGDVPPPEHL